MRSWPDLRYYLGICLGKLKKPRTSVSTVDIRILETGASRIRNRIANHSTATEKQTYEQKNVVTSIHHSIKQF